MFPSITFASEIEVSDIATKITSKPDSSGDIYYAIKATVKNNSDSPRVSVTLQAIDREGFEINDITLRGKIAQGSERILTDKTYMNHSDYKRIRKWQIK